MSAIIPIALIFLLFSASLACVATIDPDADEWMPTTTTTISPTTTTISPTTTTTRLLSCPDGTWNFNMATNFCYLVIPQSPTGDPQNECSTVGAQAASIADMTENQYITDYLVNTVGLVGYVYIGGQTSGSAALGSWSWIDGTPYGPYENWGNPSFPNPNPVSACMVMGGTGSTFTGVPGDWFNVRCNVAYRILCKRPAM